MSGLGGRSATPEAPAIICDDRTISFGELEDLHRRLAGRLHEQELKEGDRVAVLASNGAAMFAVTTGTLRAGMVPVPISPLLTDAERTHLLEDSGATLLFTDRAAAAMPSMRFVDLEQLESWLGDADPSAVAAVALTRPMHYTSGTTGRPKGVWVPPAPEAIAVARSTSFRKQWGITGSDVHLVCSPLTHSAPHRFALRTLEAGGPVVIQARFEAEATLGAIERHRVSSTFMVPTHLERILALPDESRDRYDLTSMRLLAHAGAPIRAITKERALSLWPEDSVWEFYGSTEGGFTRISPTDATARPGSVGRPEGTARVEIHDPATRGPLDRGGIGTVWLRDPGAERFEYWGDAGKTAEAWDGDAFTVGDLGSLDDGGYLYLAGRRDDVIITGGVNVYPQEVEGVLTEHPEVAEALVYGVEDPEWGQRVQALILPVSGPPPDPEALNEWLRIRLAGYKCPRTFTVVDELPRTSTGKPKRIEPGVS